MQSISEQFSYLDQQVEKLATLIRSSNNFTALTGHHIRSDASRDPAKSIMGLKGLHESKLLKTVITTNFDNQHRKSGIPDNHLIELHGNMCTSKCTKCGRIIDNASLANQLSQITSCDIAGCEGVYKSTYKQMAETID